MRRLVYTFAALSVALLLAAQDGDEGKSKTIDRLARGEVVLKKDGYLYIKGEKITQKGSKQFTLSNGAKLYVTRNSVYSLNRAFMVSFPNGINITFPEKLRVVPREVSKSKIKLWVTSYSADERLLRFVSSVTSKPFEKKLVPGQVVEVIIARDPKSHKLVVEVDSLKFRMPPPDILLEAVKTTYYTTNTKSEVLQEPFFFTEIPEASTVLPR